MNKRIFRAGLFACLLSAAAGLALAVSGAPAFAADTGPKLSAAVGKLLAPAQKALETKDYAGAMALIKQAQALPDQTPIDTYEINNFLANASIALHDYATAGAAYEAMADSPVIPDADKPGTFHNATLLAAQAKHFDKAVKYGEAYIALGGAPDPNVIATLAQSYYVTKDFAKAQATAQKALDLAPAGTAPNEAALQIILQSQLKTNNVPGEIATFEKIVTYYDSKDEWGDLIDLSFSVKGIKDVEALHIYRLRLATKAAGHADDFTTGASLALTLGYPGEAEAFLNAGVAAGVIPPGGKLMSDAHSHAAKDRAELPALEGIAAKSANGDISIKLAETYFGYGRYADAERAARAGLAKGGKTDANEANMVLGEALALQGKNADAATVLSGLHNPTPGWAKAQHIWLLFANRKYASAAP